jgi:hypothetical protein
MMQPTQRMDSANSAKGHPGTLRSGTLPPCPSCTQGAPSDCGTPQPPQAPSPLRMLHPGRSLGPWQDRGSTKVGLPPCLQERSSPPLPTHAGYGSYLVS